MRLSHLRRLALGVLVVSAPLGAQRPTNADLTARLQEVLPAATFERVSATIAAARADGLPTQPLENRALKFAARGVPAEQIERAVVQHAERMQQARTAFGAGRTETRPSGDELDAAAEAMRLGVDGAAVSALAKSAPSGRSLAVPLFVVGSLVERGLPSDQALARVRDRLQARASDAELEAMAPRGSNRPEGAPPRGGARGERAARGPGGPGGPGGVGAPGGQGGMRPGVPANGGQRSAPRGPGSPGSPGSGAGQGRPGRAGPP